MAGWHHWLDRHEFEWTPGVGDGQGGLACCDSWGRKESDTTEWLNWTELNVFFGEMSIWVFCPFFDWVLLLLLFMCISCVFWKLSPCCLCHLQIFSLVGLMLFLSLFYMQGQKNKITFPSSPNFVSILTGIWTQSVCVQESMTVNCYSKIREEGFIL